MPDRLFLLWLHDRLAIVHGVPLYGDYMLKLRAIIEATPKKQRSMGTPTYLHTLNLLKDETSGEGPLLSFD